MPTSTSRRVRLVCVSDTHNHAPGQGYTLPPGGGDILIHAGDLTNQGSVAEMRKATAWIRAAQPYRHRVVVAGNHDLALDAKYSRRRDGDEGEAWPSDEERREAISLFHRNGEDGNFIYLQHESVTLNLSSPSSTTTTTNDQDGQTTTSTPTTPLTIFGSPFSPSSPPPSSTPDTTPAWAFQYPPDSSPWDDLPASFPTSSPLIVITHTPAHDLLSASTHWGMHGGGCRSLLSALRRHRPLLHICGHCHEGRGAVVVRWTDAEDPRRCSGERQQERGGGAEGGVAGTGGAGYEVVHRWSDPAQESGGAKKMSVLDLTGTRAGGYALQAGRETAVVNAAVMGRSWSGQEGAGRKGKVFNKPIVVDVLLPVLDAHHL